MEEIKNIKKLNKKPLLICLAIALVFAVIGFIDIKSNAAESVNRTTLYYKSYVYYNNEFEYEDFNELGIPYESDSPITVYHNVVSEPITGDNRVFIHLVSKSPIIQVGQPYISDTITDVNGNEWFYMMNYVGSERLSSGYSTYHDVWFEGAENVYVLNRQYMADEFIDFFSKGELDVKVDYNSFETDDDMPIVENILRNDVVNKMHDSALETVVPDTYRYDYITWKNNSDLELQFEVCPVLQYYKGAFEKDYVKEYQGNWLKSDVLTSNTTSYLWLTRITSVEENYPEFTEWFYSIRDTYYPDWNEILNFTYGYRVRYVDKENSKAGPWVYVVPDKKYDTFKTYVQYADDTLGNSTSADGSQEVYDDLENIEDALVDVDKENQFKEEYQVYDGNIDVQQATGWLNTVVGFIKGTPQVVGSVLGFLPQPILYGMYVCIFLGIIASGIAIVKALL